MSWLVSVVDVLIKYKFVIAFYALIILIVYFNRKKFTFQAKFIALFRTKIGIKLMDKIANRHRDCISRHAFHRLFYYSGRLSADLCS